MLRHWPREPTPQRLPIAALVANPARLRVGVADHDARLGVRVGIDIGDVVEVVLDVVVTRIDVVSVGNVDLDAELIPACRRRCARTSGAS